jgi:hypothetical protein
MGTPGRGSTRYSLQSGIAFTGLLSSVIKYYNTTLQCDSIVCDFRTIAREVVYLIDSPISIILLIFVIQSFDTSPSSVKHITTLSHGKVLGI